MDWMRFEQKFAELQRRAEWMVFSGTLPPSAPDDFLLRLLRLTERPCLIDSHRAPLLCALGAQPRMVKLNREELAVTVPGLPPEAALRGLLAAGAQAVLMTDGKHPALLIEAPHPKVVFNIRPPEVRVVNPIGSGDAVTAGIVVALARGESLPEAVRFGMACGAAQTLTPMAGRLPGPAVIAELYARTVFEPISGS
jgi:fructose-1-phosphate kinase PfkB-like protein